MSLEGGASALWRRLDLPGHEACRVDPGPAGWQLAGTAVFLHSGHPCRLDYLVLCDLTWRTRSARVQGWVGPAAVELDVIADAGGRWHLSGQEQPQVAGALDLDLGFSPATNLLPIRRLALDPGTAAPVRAAWLSFPDFRLAPLDQNYRRVDPTTYAYESDGGRFTTTLTVDDQGLVVRYPGWWERVFSGG